MMTDYVARGHTWKENQAIAMRRGGAGTVAADYAASVCVEGMEVGSRAQRHSKRPATLHPRRLTRTQRLIHLDFENASQAQLVECQNAFQHSDPRVYSLTDPDLKLVFDVLSTVHKFEQMNLAKHADLRQKMMLQNLRSAGFDMRIDSHGLWSHCLTGCLSPIPFPPLPPTRRHSNPAISLSSPAIRPPICL